MTEEIDKLLKEFESGVGFLPAWARVMKEQNSDLATRFFQFREEVLIKDGALPRKTKDLIIMAMMALRRWPNGIMIHAKFAMDFGATPQEISETIFLAMLVGGPPCFTVALKTLGLVSKGKEALVDELKRVGF